MSEIQENQAGFRTGDKSLIPSSAPFQNLHRKHEQKQHKGSHGSADKADLPVEQVEADDVVIHLFSHLHLLCLIGFSGQRS